MLSSMRASDVGKVLYGGPVDWKVRSLKLDTDDPVMGLYEVNLEVRTFRRANNHIARTGFP